VSHSRYQEISSVILDHAYFKNSLFYSAVFQFYDFRETLSAIVKQYLLPFQRERKYNLEEFKDQHMENTDNLKAHFADLIASAQQIVLDLYSMISQPKMVTVSDADFPDVHRRNPNLGQLMFLERRKAIARAEKTTAVNREITTIGGLIRMIDYMLLENLSSGCVHAWRVADSIVSRVDAAVFQVEVWFDPEGAVSFSPLLSDLTETISGVLSHSISTLGALPRLLLVQQLRPLLRDNGLELPSLYEQRPKVEQIIPHYASLDEIQTRILATLKHSYEKAMEQSQFILEYWPIFQLGVTSL
jgi:hypothetical protein